MNGKRAKQIRREVKDLVKDLPPEPDEYHQLQNCVSWRHAVVDGKPQYDGDGVPLLEAYNAPGTLRHAQPFMVIYKMKKAKYYKERARERGSC